MRISDALDKFDDGQTLYVVKEIDIRWDTMRFLNTTITPATYAITISGSTLWDSRKVLTKVNLPSGTGQYSDKLTSSATKYRCFKTQKEAEVWKIIELHQLEDKVEKHIDDMKKKTKNKIKKLHQKEKFDEYLEKYPEEFLKVIR